MDEETKRAIWIVGRWLLEFVRATDLDRLLDRVNSERVDSDRKMLIADELRLALGYGCGLAAG